MPRYVVLSRLTHEGRRGVPERFRTRSSLEGEAAAVGGRVLEQYATLGEYDFCAIVELPNNAAAQLLGSAVAGARGVDRVVAPAIDLPLFTRLLGQTTQTTGPHAWQVLLAARLFRSAVRPIISTRWARRYFRPFVVSGLDRVDSLRGPAIFIANHASHFDAFAFIEALPRRYRNNIYFGSAADRWYIKGRRELYKQGWWRSLAYGSFPIQRGGGSKTLAYAETLIDRGGSIGIFPEGTRTTTGKIGKFKPGPSILALKKNVPVVPLFMDGLRHLLPKDGNQMRAGPVQVEFGDPIRFLPGTDVDAATRTLRHELEELKNRSRARRLAEETKRRGVHPPLAHPGTA
jgi:1-acyl-sn-glycerol-3-phosphate acyltransferase